VGLGGFMMTRGGGAGGRMSAVNNLRGPFAGLLLPPTLPAPPPPAPSDREPSKGNDAEAPSPPAPDWKYGWIIAADEKPGPTPQEVFGAVGIGEASNTPLPWRNAPAGTERGPAGGRAPTGWTVLAYRIVELLAGLLGADSTKTDAPASGGSGCCGRRVLSRSSRISCGDLPY
jgi:hypothetical protein